MSAGSLSLDQYELYCLADRQFYDVPASRGDENPDFSICARPVPVAWEHHTSDVWMNYAPTDVELPSQGWKIHVSAGLDDAERVLTAVWDYCVPRGVAFKFLRSQSVTVMFNSKSAFRGSSGKLATIYPANEADLELTLKELDGILTGIPGPYILSDLRYGAGPLFVRYGGFAERHCRSESGERVLALEDSEGRLVPDQRGPTFAIPSWVTLPAFLEPHLKARNAVTVDGLDYEIDSVIQFSNGGGVYLGRHRHAEDRVVLKEARPLAGLDALGRDAVTRISHERDILDRLSGLDEVPAVRDYVTVGEHQFLVEEFIDGTPLQRLVVGRHPLTHPDVSEEALAEYAAWALGMIARVERAVQALHRRGVVFNDLHPDNVLIGVDDRLVLIDFEVATLADDRARSALAHPGYAAPDDRDGVDVDRYALACLALGLFAPQATIMLQLHPGKAAHLAQLICETFPVPWETIDSAVRTIVGSGQRPDGELAAIPMPGRAAWTDVRDAITRAIVASATPWRDDRLFPGDVAQFGSGGGASFAHGAAGVLYALARTGAGRFPEYEQWLCHRALRPATGVGFYDGLHGMAYVLAELGHWQPALAVMDQAQQHPAMSAPVMNDPAGAPDLGLYSGLAGVGLNLLHFAAATGDPAFDKHAFRIVEDVADRLGGPDEVAEISGEGHPRAGLMYGSSGPALLFVHAYERTGDSGLLDLAAIALRQDLCRCVRTDDETLQVNQGWRTLPYLEEGSAGVAMVLDRYLRHRPNDPLAESLELLRRVFQCRYFVQAGLFMGRSGILAAAATLGRSAGQPLGSPDAVTARLVRDLEWHALPYGGGLAFPGDQLLRLSMDLATGTAGALLALGAALHDAPTHLPFLGGPPGHGRPDPSESWKEV
jgi:predicted Ser/Thr protein kinase